MGSITIDGVERSFEPGETIIRVTERENVEVPYYCWHPRLSVAANCRMCLVEVEGAPKLAPACQTECRDGMKVNTQNAKVKDAQRAVHEFLLINHPIDCPICDQAGECKLQDYYMQYHKTPSRRADERVRKHKVEQIGPRVIYDAERCILCTRCVRFMDEVAKDPQLGVFNRGDHAVIGVAGGTELDSQYSLNTVDVCPVGALTSAQFRFKQRAWNLKRQSSVCPGCARGCNVHVDHRSGQVFRLLPRDNDAVNQSWMCDDGRGLYREPNDQRITHALVRVGEDPDEVTTSDALEAVTKLLEPLVDHGDGVAVAMSLYTTVEEAYVVARFAQEVFGAGVKVVLLERDNWRGDDILRVEDHNPNRAGITRVLEGLGVAPMGQAALLEQLRAKKIKALITLGHETSLLEPLAKEAHGLEVHVHVGYARSALTYAAKVALPSVAWVQLEGTWVNVDGRAQALLPAFPAEGSAKPISAWLGLIATELAKDLDVSSIATVRADLEAAVPAFKNARLSDLDPAGRVLGSA